MNSIQTTENNIKYIFGNFGGLVPQPYVKYFNLMALEIICIFIFTIFHFFALQYYDTSLLHYDKFTTKHFYYFYIFWRALLNSINYQSNANYTPIQFKHIIPQTMITFQLIISLALIFFFLTV